MCKRAIRPVPSAHKNPPQDRTIFCKNKIPIDFLHIINFVDFDPFYVLFCYEIPCKKPKFVISGNLSKMTVFEPTSTELKIKFDPSLDRS